MSTDKLSFDTRAVKAGREDFEAIGVHAPPMDFSTTYPLNHLESSISDFANLANGNHPNGGSSIYARLHNPTVDRFEKALANLESAEAGVAFSSGMAALTAVLTAARQSGGHAVAVRPVYGGTDHILSSGLTGLRVSWCSAEEIETNIEPDTSLIIVETPANPTLDLVDISAVVKQAGEIPVLVDSTFATPVIQKPLDYGATYVLHSATKFIGGHGDVVAGVVACNEQRAKLLRQIRIITGSILHPMAAYLLHRGLQTLPIRYREAQRNARFLANELSNSAEVRKVYYPGLKGSKNSHLIGSQMSGTGAMLAFELEGDFERAAKFINSLNLITVAVSLGSTDTLIQHPAGLTHSLLTEQVKKETNISETLIRISAGLENVSDIWADIKQALRASSAVFRSSQHLQ